jgi:hypothetical protein
MSDLRISRVIGYPRNDIPVWGYLALETTENVVLFPDRFV